MRLKQLTPNFHQATSNYYDVFFSYETPIAVITRGGTCYVAKNQWSRTTGKHINYIKREYNAYEVEYEELQGIIDLELT